MFQPWQCQGEVSLILVSDGILTPDLGNDMLAETGSYDNVVIVFLNGVQQHVAGPSDTSIEKNKCLSSLATCWASVRTAAE